MPLQHTKGNRSPSIADTIRIDGVPFDLAGSSVKFRMRPEESGTLKVDAAATVIAASTTLTGPHVLPVDMLTVASTSGFLDAGALVLGGQIVFYTAKTSTTFLGCTKGEGSIAGGSTVAQIGGVRYDWSALDVDTAGDFLFWWEVTLPSLKTQDTPEDEIAFVDHVPAEPGFSERALVTIREARSYVYRDENDDSRDDVLADAVNYVSETIWDECQREFLPTTLPARSGSDGVTNGTTTFTSASAAFTADDVGALVSIVTKGYYRIAAFTNSTTVTLNGSPSAGTALAWQFSETRTFELGRRGLIDLAPYDLLELDQVVLYSDQAAPDALASDEFKLLPVGRSPGGTYLALRTIWPGVSELQPGFGWEAQVSGFWGMSEVPSKIKAAALLWIKNLVENPGVYASSSMSGYTVVPEVETTATLVRAGMPPAVRYRLVRWSRGGLVA